MKRAVSIFVAGLVVRLIAVAYLAHVKPGMLTWGINEAGGIARWIVTNHSFSSPFHDAHGPTAWLGPIYPLIVAGIFLVFGVQTSASALAVMVFNSVCSATTGVVIYEMGKDVYSEKAGLFAGWMWAVSPPIAILPFIPWDTSLSALVLSAALLLTLRLQSDKSEGWAACGATWGVAALVNPTLLIPLPILALLLSEHGKRWRRVLIMIALAVIVIVPWTVRNYVVFHEFMLVRSNGLAEVYFANGGFGTHPLGQSMEYQRVGEAAFTAQANRRAVEYIRTHPGTFLLDSIHRAILFWIYPTNFWFLSVGVDLAALVGLIVLVRKSSPSGLPLLAVLVVYPLVFYASQVVSRYRHPIEPVLYALSGIALSSVSLKRVSVRLGKLNPTWTRQHFDNCRKIAIRLTTQRGAAWGRRQGRSWCNRLLTTVDHVDQEKSKVRGLTPRAGAKASSCTALVRRPWDLLTSPHHCGDQRGEHSRGRCLDQLQEL